MAVADPCEGIALGGRQLGLERDLADDAGRDGEHASARFGDGARGGPDLDAGIAPAHLLDGVTETDAVAEPLCERQGQALVAAGDAGEGSSPMCATPSRSTAGTSSAGLADEISRRASIVSRAPSEIGSSARSSLALGLPATAASASRAAATARLELGVAYGKPAARLAAPVPHPLVGEGETKLVGQRSNLGVAGKDELGSHLGDGAAGQSDGPRAAADAIAGLEHLDRPAAAGEQVGRDQTRKPGTDHDYTVSFH